ncbi:MAG: LpxD N-terminal domain-containing protein, partial [Candidatus Omnitrophota bacterium]
GVAGIQEAGEGDITFLANSKYLPFLRRTKAAAVITSPEIDSGGKPAIKVDNPSLVFTKAMNFILPKKECYFRGIHKNAVIGMNVKLGKDLAVGACAVIEDGCSIGDNTIIYPNSYIGREASVGSDTLIYLFQCFHS